MDKDSLIENKGNGKKTFYFLSRKQKCFIICNLFFGMGFFILSFFLPKIVNDFVNNEIPKKVVMTEETSGLWAELPGDSGVNLYRKITLYEPTNMVDVIFRGAKPKFIEHPNVYTLIQEQKFMDRQYDDDTVKCNRYTTFQEPQQDINKYQIANPGMFGGWYLGKSAEPPKLAWMTIGQVIQNVKDVLPLNVYFLGFHYNFAKDEASASAMLQAEQDPNKRHQMYVDELMGLGNVETMENWIRLGLEGHDYGVAGQALKDYFDLNQETLSDLRSSIQTAIKGLNESAFPYYGCNPYGQDPSQKQFKYDCDGKYLAAYQWSTQGITANPPPGMGIIPTPSINYTNGTLHDHIEIAFYYDAFFKKEIADYGNMKFDLDWAYEFLNREYDYPTKPAMTEPYRLQHKGNIEYMYEEGAKFDKSQNLNDLQGIMDRFRTESLEQAHVVYKWLQQMQIDFACRTNIKGNQEFGVLGIFGSESIYYRFRNITEVLLPYLISDMVMNKQQWKDCADFLQQSIDEITQEQIDLICSEPKFKTITAESILAIQSVCIFGIYGPRLDDFQQRNKLSETQKMQICAEGETDQSYQTLIENAHQELKQKYQCTYSHCSKMELAIKQWARSEITLNPPESSTLPISYTINEWFPSIFPQPCEYGYYAHEFADLFDDEEPIQVIDDLMAKVILSKEVLFNPLQVTSAFVYKENHPKYYDKFYTVYKFEQYDHLLYYIRFMVINIMLGGPTVSKTPKELFFGYSEQLGEDLKYRDPAGGGDLGINSWVRLGDPNMTESDRTLFPQSMNTGSQDVSKTRFYQTLNSFDKAMYNYSYFDGNTTTTKWTNPWDKDEYFNTSTDGVIFPPFRNNKDVLTFFVPQVFRNLYFLPSDGPELFGLKTIHYDLDISKWDSEDEYLSVWNGTLNLERPFQAPAIVSLPHFYLADPKLSESVEIKDKEGNIVKPNDYDKIYANIESYSGAPLQAVIQLQINMRLQKDNLFTKSEDIAIPILVLYNSGNFTEDAASAQYGELKIGLSVASWGWYIMMGLGIILITISVTIVVYAYRKRNRATTVDLV